MSATTYRDRLAAYFKDRPHKWIDGMELESIAGKYAWRSRVSDCRRELAMTIVNKQIRIKNDYGKRFTISFYKYVPPVERQGEPTADLNAWSLR